MATLDAWELVTIGYEGRSAESLIQALVREEVGLVADVRLTPLSRKPGLSKNSLMAGLAAAGIKYEHLPALGNPRENREAFRAGESSSRDRFQSLMGERVAGLALSRLEELLHRFPVALLCFERDAHACHRQLVSDELVRRHPSLNVGHA